MRDPKYRRGTYKKTLYRTKILKEYEKEAFYLDPVWNVCLTTIFSFFGNTCE